MTKLQQRIKVKFQLQLIHVMLLYLTSIANSLYQKYFKII